MDDIDILIHDLTKFVERNYAGIIGIGEDHISIKTDKEVFVITVTKESLEDWE